MDAIRDGTEIHHVDDELILLNTLDGALPLNARSFPPAFPPSVFRCRRQPYQAH